MYGAIKYLYDQNKYYFEETEELLNCIDQIIH